MWNSNRGQPVASVKKKILFIKVLSSEIKRVAERRVSLELERRDQYKSSYKFTPRIQRMEEKSI